MTDKLYWYGMRLRPFSIGAQPKGVCERKDDASGKYWDCIAYQRPLSEKDLLDYELDYLGDEEAVNDRV